ncbi:MAG: metal ABC transporter permease, partial [Cyanobacteriota bacterium]|nr:metal ABC transporter permease [Cyanobacteriota bacterium]
MAALSEPFWLLPLLLAGLCGLSCPLLGTLLVLQRRVLTTNLMAYAVLPGVVIGQALGLPPLLTGLASALAAVLLVEARIAARRDAAGAAEALLNTVLAASLGLGVLLVQVLELPVDLEGLLFGDLLVAEPADLARMGLALLLVLLVIRGRFQQWQWLGLDPDGAERLELPVRGLRLAMAALTALVVVSATAAVGLALVMALICAPSLAALADATSLCQALRRAALIGLVVSLVGCALAVGLNLPPGPLMASCCLPLLLRRG